MPTDPREDYQRWVQEVEDMEAGFVQVRVEPVPGLSAISVRTFIGGDIGLRLVNAFYGVGKTWVELRKEEDGSWSGEICNKRPHKTDKYLPPLSRSRRMKEADIKAALTAAIIQIQEDLEIKTKPEEKPSVETEVTDDVPDSVLYAPKEQSELFGGYTPPALLSQD